MSGWKPKACVRCGETFQPQNGNTKMCQACRDVEHAPKPKPAPVRTGGRLENERLAAQLRRIAANERLDDYAELVEQGRRMRAANDPRALISKAGWGSDHGAAVA